MANEDHKHLWSICERLPEDWQPYGDSNREDAHGTGTYGADCSCGCRWFYPLKDKPPNLLSMDWGVCGNPASHRCGLLTFEHQGCRSFDPK